MSARYAGAGRAGMMRVGIAGGRGKALDEGHLLARLNILRIEHRDLDSAIAALGAASVPDQLQLMRLKKRKLKLRDEISELEDLLTPDIIA
jgi:hypothetical protein